jgi:hypothetical protein
MSQAEPEHGCNAGDNRAMQHGDQTVTATRNWKWLASFMRRLVAGSDAQIGSAGATAGPKRAGCCQSA